MNHARLKEELVAAAKQSYQDRLFAGTSGNLSVFDPVTDTMLITPSSIPYMTMQMEDIVSMKLDGTVLEGAHAPSSEWRMHAGIYQNRPDILAVVHTHSPYATSFAVTHTPIPVILIEMVPFLGGEVLVSGFGLPGTLELGMKALEVLEQHHTCLMANHGVLAVGQTLQQAHIRAVYVEDAAKIHALAMVHGTPCIIEEENINAMKSRKSGH